MQESEDTVDGAPSAPSEGSAPGAPGEGKKKRPHRAATGTLRGRPKPGSVEYELIRLQTAGVYPYPWRRLQHDAERKVELTSRCNEWEYEVIRYASTLDKQSMSRYVLKHALTAALKRIIQQEKDEQPEETG